MVCGLRTGLDGRAEIDGSPMTRKWYLTAAQAAQMNLSPVPPLLDEQIARHNAAVAADREHDAKVAEIAVDSLLVGCYLGTQRRDFMNQPTEQQLQMCAEQCGAMGKSGFHSLLCPLSEIDHPSRPGGTYRPNEARRAVKGQ